MKSVLIANRGEIALRIIRACRELGIRSIAIHSDADVRSPHVRAADAAIRIGPAPAPESYLRTEAILEAARKSGAEGIHPGYGFLSERAHFAREVEAAGFVWIGPPPAAISAMGDKTEARRRMAESGVPIVPGTLEPVHGTEAALRIAEGIGYPVLLKAAAGGGGRGMRVARSAEELARGLDAAAREAAAAFGDGSVYIERFLDRPRHVEIQLLADGQGGIVHLGERECSIQRRHQKLVEEAPCPGLSPSLRDAMGTAAIRAAETVDYRGAGTVEFLLEGDAFHFLEMNTRIQVEHPVTEAITGIDLVAWQLRIARGEVLDFSQSEVRFRGHAIECRITAEDPEEDFLPSAGTISHLRIPSGPGVRWDGGVEEGSEAGLWYDSLLGKLIVHATDRPSAIRRMQRALGELRVGGVRTVLPFHRALMEDPGFLRGDVDIRFLEDRGGRVSRSPSGDELRFLAALAVRLEGERRSSTGRGPGPMPPSTPQRAPWADSPGGFPW